MNIHEVVSHLTVPVTSPVATLDLKNSFSSNTDEPAIAADFNLLGRTEVRGGHYAYSTWIRAGSLSSLLSSGS
jgi:hypothetical protein